MRARPNVDAARPAGNSDEIKQPVFFCPTVKAVMLELIYDYNLEVLIDGTPGDGSAAMACLEAGKPYVGVCLTPTHVEKLYKRLDALVWEAFQQESSPLLQPDLVEIMKGRTPAPPQASAPHPGQADDPPVPTPKRKPAKKSAKKKKNKKRGSSDSSSSDSHS